MSRKVDISIDAQKISPVLLDDILNELRMIRSALTDLGVVLPLIISMRDGESRIINDNPTVYYKDVDIMNRGPGKVFVMYETLRGPLSKPKVDRSVEIEVANGETDSLTFNEPRIGRIWLRADGDVVLKIIFTA
ncbi:MAG: hypothetical protein QXE50_05975 [Nitrososphaerota archaeon]